MNNNQTTNSRESWQAGYISNNTRLIVVYSHPSSSNTTNKPVK